MTRMTSIDWKAAFLAGIATFALSACESEKERAPHSSAEKGDTKGVGEDWGDNPNCLPSGCPTETTSSTRSSDSQTVRYEPKFLGLMHITLGKKDDIQAAHSLYEINACKEAFRGKIAHEEILIQFEKNSNSPPPEISTPHYPWPTKGDCTPIDEGTGTNFQGIMYFGQTDIYIDVDGLKSEFDDRHAVLFTKYSAGNRTTPVEENMSFYEAEVQSNSTQTGDSLLKIKNYYAHDYGYGWKPVNPPADRANPKKPLIYSMNIHLLAGSAKIPIIVDPDTGNGSDD